MAEYIVQKPIDRTKLTAKATAALPAVFDITPKFDGCCVVFLFGQLGQYVGAFSATGERVVSMEHVGRYIEDNWHILAKRNKAVVGEAWLQAADFPTISGTFRRQSPQPELQFAPFDMVGWTASTFDKPPALYDERPYADRIEPLLEQPHGGPLVPVPHHRGDLAYGDKLARELKAKGGYDGAIARDADAPYTVGRSKGDVIKLKPVLELDLRVVELTETVGEKTGRAVYTCTVEYRGVHSEVGSGMPHKFEELPKLGDIVAIEAMGVHPSGLLREPRFKGVRHDKIETD
jgi:hypothetical protein